MNCTICKEPLDPVSEKSTTHPGCFPFAELDEGDTFTTMLKTQLIDVILWAEKQNPRGSQVPIGPSELGTPCDRRLGYRLAGIKPCNTEFDPWPMIVGTAVHSWLDHAFSDWMVTHHSGDWATETSLHLDEIVRGHADLYNHTHQAVIDWKGVGPDVMRKIRRDGVPVGYQIQTHLYGYGFRRMGWPVKKVCLAFLPRAGWLKDMYLWCDDYNETIAIGAIARLYEVAQQIMSMDILKNSHRWEQVPAEPTNDCGWCPHYDPSRPLEQGATDTGCPGR